MVFGSYSPPCLLYFCNIAGMPKNQGPAVVSSVWPFQIPVLPLRTRSTERLNER